MSRFDQENERMLSPHECFFWGWFMPAFLALSLFLSFTAHLRQYTGGVVGPGEVMMGLVAAFGLIFCRPWRLWRKPFVLFWLLLALTMFVGSQVATLPGHWQARNTQAYVFTGVVTVGVLALLGRLSNQGLRRALLFLCLFAAVGIWVGFAVYLTGDVALNRSFMLDDMGGDLRFTAWTSNANQLALFFLPLPVWLAAYWRDVMSPRWYQTLGFGGLLFALMLMGLLVRSDALFLVWICEFLILLFLRLRWDLKVSRWSMVGYGVAMIFCVLLVKTFAHGEVRKSFQCATQTLSQGVNPWKAKCYNGAFQDQEAVRIGYGDPVEKASIREGLWINGLKAWMASPLFGHGPGAYSWYSDPEFQKAEEAGGKFREESHNITVDLMTQGGVFLGAAWVALLLYLLQGAWRIRDSYSFSVVLMIGVFTFFMYHLRQPFLWFTLMMSHEAIRRGLFTGSADQIMADKTRQNNT